MATLNFPSDPGGVGPSTYTANGITYDWTGVYWKARVDNVGVDKIVAGTNVTIDPAGGEGVVTINSTGGGGGAVGTLQQVTDAGNTTDNSIEVAGAVVSGRLETKDANSSVRIGNASNTASVTLTYTKGVGASYSLPSYPTSDGQVLASETDGTLSWADAGSGNLQEVTDAGNTTTNSIDVGSIECDGMHSSANIVGPGFSTDYIGGYTANVRPNLDGVAFRCINKDDFDKLTLLIEGEGTLKIGGTLPDTPNISLNADGDGVFGSRVQLGANWSDNDVAGIRLALGSDSGTVLVKGKTGINEAFSVRAGGSSQAATTARINMDGTADFLGGTVKIDNIGGGRIVSGNGANDQPGITLVQNGALNVNTAVGAMTAITVRSAGTETVSIGNNGSASFAGDVTTGTIDTTDNTTASGEKLFTDGLIRVQRPGDGSSQSCFQSWTGNKMGFQAESDGTTYIGNTAASGANTSSSNITLNADGSAVLAGDVQVGGNPLNGAAVGSQVSQFGFLRLSRSGSTTNPALQIYSSFDSSLGCEILANGSATFAGTIQGVNLTDGTTTRTMEDVLATQIHAWGTINKDASTSGSLNVNGASKVETGVYQITFADPTNHTTYAVTTSLEIAALSDLDVDFGRTAFVYDKQTTGFKVAICSTSSSNKIDMSFSFSVLALG